MARETGKRSTKVTHAPSEARHHAEEYQGRPDEHHAERLDGPPVGTAVCPQCHAIWHNKHWSLDEPHFQELVIDAATPQIQCPGCRQVERQEYDGEVTLTSPLIPQNEQAVLGLIRNTEQHIREHNPIARIASLTVNGDTIRVLTISTFLAERIGKELKKAYDGHLELSRPEREEFIRVTWVREK